jgi:hypothetical protein
MVSEVNVTVFIFCALGFDPILVQSNMAAIFHTCVELGYIVCCSF